MAAASCGWADRIETISSPETRDQQVEQAAVAGSLRSGGERRAFQAAHLDRAVLSQPLRIAEGAGEQRAAAVGDAAIQVDAGRLIRPAIVVVLPGEPRQH